MEEMINDSNIESKPVREKKIATKVQSIKSETTGLKLTLPMEVSQRLQDSFAVLKDRGYGGKIEDMIMIIWEQTSLDWCEARIDALTPDEYYLDATKQIPEIRQKLVDQAKKALLKAKDEIRV